MNTVQQGDVLFEMTPDGGEMNIEEGITEMSVLYDSFILTCLMGGNRHDDGTATTASKQYMGNEDEEPQNQLRSRFHALLYGRPMTSSLAKELGEAAALDVSDGMGEDAKNIIATVSILSNKRMSVSVDIELTSGEIIRRRIEIGIPQ